MKMKEKLISLYGEETCNDARELVKIAHNINEHIAYWDSIGKFAEMIAIRDACYNLADELRAA
ncbi:hypothetical protein FWH09_00755 [Candidatus Saccharibacteria bacterium]|nr:hypothetical protein [Candidatus Saccharibacteria bacterium]